ncbi:2-hydroxyacid dehydrogenase [Pigmentiphaga litoralis]|uniref:D-2-hydroxyacid dehydrogenase family protein n=1 Tax=Pigmentiphaga litoralis TaxID=516702 RepID=UPI001679F20D|nr:D-2-hydroxyacid dehydrogenase family protein [Pigmentiphaga litoralis]GGX30710.1 2-hydroxyacid dehydrogenase [Pigmentiphaga litoralis]
MKIAVLDDYHGVAGAYADWKTLGDDAKVTTFPHYLPEGLERDAALKPFDVIIAMRERTPFPASQIAALPNLKLLVTTGLKNNAIDVPACVAQGIAVCGAPGSPDANFATSELAWTLLLALFKNLPYENESMRQGQWQTRMPVPLAGKRLGVVGLGRLGAAMARVGLAFGMDVVAWSPNLTDDKAAEAGVKRVEKHELFATSDAISLHLVLSARSRHVVDAAAIDAMKPGAFLVNTSRAGLVDSDALMRALMAHKIGGAGLDVFDQEPLPADHPIRTLDNVVLTPHLGYVSEDNFRAFYQNALAAVQAWKAGKPINVLSK